MSPAMDTCSITKIGCGGLLPSSAVEEDKLTRAGAMAEAAMVMAKNMEKIEQLLNYRFKNPRLLAEALTHTSYTSSGKTYQRLEFLGDTVLSTVLSNHLLLVFPDAPPGHLSQLRACNISTEKLARVAIHHDLYSFLLRDSAEHDAMVHDFTAAVEAEDAPNVYGGGSIRAPKVLADVVESIIGAVYMDCEFNVGKTWAHIRGMLEPIVTEDDSMEHPVSVLHEVCHKNGKSLEIKNLATEENDCRKNVTKVFVDGELVGVGSSQRKNIARINAARDALNCIITNNKIKNSSDSDSDDKPAASAALEDHGKEGKKILREFCNRKRWRNPEYRVDKEEGAPHLKRYRCQVTLHTPEQAYIEFGDFKSKIKDSQNSAAHKMFESLPGLNLTKHED